MAHNCYNHFNCLCLPLAKTYHLMVRMRQKMSSSKSHYSNVIMGAIASQITSLTIVYSTVHSGAHQRKHQSSVSLTFVRGIHREPVNSPHKWPVTWKMFSFDDVIMPPMGQVGGSPRNHELAKSYGQTDKVNPVYTTPTSLGGGIMIRHQLFGVRNSCEYISTKQSTNHYLNPQWLDSWAHESCHKYMCRMTEI